jgi:predicted secreted protein with PEFG-CTERM motif
MNSYAIHALIALSVLIGVMTTLPIYAALAGEEAKSEGISYKDFQLARLSDVPIRIWTDKEIYDYGSVIHVDGVVANLRGDSPVTVRVIGPQGNVVGVQQIQITESKTFSVTFSAAGNLWKQNGIYTIKVQYGPQEINDKVKIELQGAAGIKVSTCSQTEITVKSKTDVYCVPFNAVDVKVTTATVSKETTSIVLMIDAESDGTLTLTIPRNVLDSQSNGGSDSPFIVLVDGEDGDAFEVVSDATTRTLEIDIPEGATEIEIIGTFAVPEFGTMAAIILAVAIVSIIAVSARTRLSILSKY